MENHSTGFICDKMLSGAWSKTCTIAVCRRSGETMMLTTAAAPACVVVGRSQKQAGVLLHSGVQGITKGSCFLGFCFYTPVLPSQDMALVEDPAFKQHVPSRECWVR